MKRPGLRGRGALGLALLGSALVAAGSTPARAEALSVAEYKSRLLAIEARLERGDWVGARVEARAVLAGHVAFGGESVVPDASVLGPVAAAKNGRDAGVSARRVARLASALATLERERANAPSAAAAAGDQARLARAREREKLTDLPAGGVLPAPKPPAGALAVLSEFFEPLRRALAAMIEKIGEWLQRFWTGLAPKKPGGLSVPALSTVLVVLSALGLAGLAIAFVRRRRGAKLEPAGSEPLRPPPAADDDPLSREVDEWQRYARDLEGAGRLREAVRAWYHAVLVALYRGGFLHYRKGRTNWEYVAALAPGLPMRPGFSDLTRLFEREWYGRDESRADDLAAAAELAGVVLGGVRGERRQREPGREPA